MQTVEETTEITARLERMENAIEGMVQLLVSQNETILKLGAMLTALENSPVALRMAGLSAPKESRKDRRLRESQEANEEGEEGAG